MQAKPKTHTQLCRCATAALLLVCSTSHAAELVVKVHGFKNGDGTLGCALFAAAQAERFPLDLSQATTQRQPVVATATANTAPMRCEFTGLAAGRYAASASHDVNGNGKPDRNWAGLPTEPWAVSNNARPRLRAPRFAEAAFELAADESKQIDLYLAD
jgi:uncharacterized protein (DUF2141 family)